MAKNDSVPTRDRKSFSRIETSLPIPNLIDVQRRSYERFLQMNLLPEERENHGLQAVFNGIFPFSDFRETCSLDFVKYSLGDWQCKCGELRRFQCARSSCARGSVLRSSWPFAVLSRVAWVELQGLEYLRMTCTNCGSKIMTDHPHEQTVDCAECAARRNGTASRRSSSARSPASRSRGSPRTGRCR